MRHNNKFVITFRKFDLEAGDGDDFHIIMWKQRASENKDWYGHEQSALDSKLFALAEAGEDYYENPTEHTLLTLTEVDAFVGTLCQRGTVELNHRVEDIATGTDDGWANMFWRPKEYPSYLWVFTIMSMDNMHSSL